jgi:hypothetical protein
MIKNNNISYRIQCKCNYCGASWKIPRERILFFEEFHEIQKGQKYVWECDQCMIGVVVPSPFVNGYGEKISLEIENLPNNITIIQIIPRLKL